MNVINLIPNVNKKLFLYYLQQFYRVYMGTANDYDDHIRARGANASIVGEAFGTTETKDMFLENQELKVINSRRTRID